VVTSYATGTRKQLDEDGDGPGSVWNFLVCLAMDLGGKGMAMTGMHFKQGTFFQGYIKCVDKTIATSMGKKVATHMIVLLSNAFFQSPMCMVEVHHAIQSNIQLVLVNTEELDWPIEEKAWPLKVSKTRYPFSDGTVNWGDAEFAGNRAAVLRAVTGDNSYPRPGRVVRTWGRDGGMRVIVWMVDEVGGRLHPNSHAGGKAMVPSTLAALDGRPTVEEIRPDLEEDDVQERKAMPKGSVDEQSDKHDGVLQVWCTVVTHCVFCRYGRTILTHGGSCRYGRNVLTHCGSCRYRVLYSYTVYPPAGMTYCTHTRCILLRV
jgi:hypothetical protein